MMKEKEVNSLKTHNTIIYTILGVVVVGVTGYVVFQNL